MRRRTRPFRTPFLYFRALLSGFRWTLAVLLLAVLAGAALYSITPLPQLRGERPPLDIALYAAWMALFAQPIQSPPDTWYLEIVCVLYPLLGFLLIGDGIVRMSLLLISRERGEKDWMKVMASTHRDHVVLCGLGHLGSRILDRLVASNVGVVVLEKDPQARFLPEARATGAPVLIRDMKDDQALVEAGVPHARCIVIATNDDIANLEVALDARRLNPSIKIVMRMFDQQIADKVKGAFAIDQAFSSAALAAPLVAAMSQHGVVLASFAIGGIAYMTSEVVVERASALAGKSVAELEARYAVRVLAIISAGGETHSPADAARVLGPGDRAVVHTRADGIEPLLAAARPG